MTQILLRFLLLCLFSLSLFASCSEEKCYTPRLFNGTTQGFCFYHLLNDPETCSTRDFLKDGTDVTEFLEKESATAYVDPELTQKLHSLAHLILSYGTCNFRSCNQCHEPAAHRSWRKKCFLQEKD